MPYYGSADIIAMLKGPLGLDVTIGGTATRGFLDEEDVVNPDVTGEPRKVRQMTLTILSGSAEATMGETVIIDGISYVARDTLLQADGALTTIVVART